MNSPTARQAAEAVISRLLQMRQLWEDAADAYFAPDRFLLALQNCITTSRTVTFIMQANKSEFEGFDEWYAKQQEEMRLDPVMQWAKEARNEIEKRGDLETFSQVRAEIIAEYLDGPKTGWMPQALFASPQKIWASIPQKYLVQHVVDNGTLLIERRWVDKNLPNMEILEALGHVYLKLENLISNFITHYNIKARLPAAAVRPDAMGELAMNRAIYLSVKDGTTRGFRFYKKLRLAPTKKDRKKLVERYGKEANWKSLIEADTFRKVADAYFEHARIILMRDGYHRPFAFFLKDKIVIRIANTDHPDRASRYVLMRDLAKLARIDGADGVMLISEAWTARGPNLPASGYAVDAENRGEALVMHAVNSLGEMFSLEAPFTRRRPGSKKIKRIEKTRYDDEATQFILFPFVKEWGILSKEMVRNANELMDKLDMRISGIKTE